MTTPGVGPGAESTLTPKLQTDSLVVAADCERPTTLGTRPCAVPDETIIVTVLPVVYREPAAGDCDITVPDGWLLAWWTTETAYPAPDRVDFAADSLVPTTPGTVAEGFLLWMLQKVVGSSPLSNCRATWRGQ